MIKKYLFVWVVCSTNCSSSIRILSFAFAFFFFVLLSLLHSRFIYIYPFICSRCGCSAHIQTYFHLIIAHRVFLFAYKIIYYRHLCISRCYFKPHVVQFIEMFVLSFATSLMPSHGVYTLCVCTFPIHTSCLCECGWTYFTYVCNIKVNIFYLFFVQFHFIYLNFFPLCMLHVGV